MWVGNNRACRTRHNLNTHPDTRMAVLSLPLSFTNSFWTQDYRKGLEILFSKLEQVCSLDLVHHKPHSLAPGGRRERGDRCVHPGLYTLHSVWPIAHIYTDTCICRESACNDLAQSFREHLSKYVLIMSAQVDPHNYLRQMAFTETMAHPSL